MKTNIKWILCLIFLFNGIGIINAQTSFTLGGHSLLRQDGTLYELVEGHLTVVDTLDVVITFKTHKASMGSDKLVNQHGFVKRFTYPNNDNKCKFHLPESSGFIDSYNILSSMSEIEDIKIGHYKDIAYISDIILPDDEHHVAPLYWELKKTSVTYWEDWNGAQPYAWSLSVGHPSVIVAVLDDGLTWNDPDFSPDNMLGYDYYDGDYNTEPVRGYYSHGTSIASIIAGRTGNQHGLSGIAGGFGQNKAPATLLIQRIASKNAMGWLLKTIEVPQAIYDAVDQGARIITMGWGDQDWFDEDINDALDYATSQDVILIAAAGNEGQQVVSWPALKENVIAVSGTRQNDTRISWYPHSGSNMGIDTEIAFPGMNVETTQLPLNSPTAPGTGTSISCAMASGVAALMLSVNPCLTAAEVRSFLRESCEQVGGYDYHNSDPDNPGHSLELGYGRVNAYTAVSLAFSHNDIVINGNEVINWNQNQTITGTVTIKGNGILNIENCEITAHANSKFIVEPGGKLTINNAVLKDYCNTPWQGIEVWGNSAHHQFPDRNGVFMQGRVELNDATIENAICALNLCKPGDYSKTGGIAYANNTVFKNNQRSVHALYYDNYHPSSGQSMEYNAGFESCTFSITGDYLSAFSTFNKHVDLNNVNGIRFKACDFSLSPDAPGVSDYNQAIAAYSAGFKVESICTQAGQNGCLAWIPSTFSGFRTGITVANTDNQINPIYVNKAEFTGNSNGIVATGAKSTIITNSTFHLDNNNFSTEPCSYGVYMNNSSGFAVEENEFFKTTGAPLADYIGVGIIECPTIEEVYKNEFTGLSAGNYAFGKNWELEEYEGLVYLCNKNTSNFADFYVTGNDPSHGIQSKQGNILLPAGNEFSPTGATWHFYNETKNLIGYYYCTTCPNQYPEYVEYVTREPVTAVNTCPSHYGGGILDDIILDNQQKTERELSFVNALNNLNNVETLYINLKDGGITEVKIDEITNAVPSDMWSLRSALLGDSPHLSEDVLKLVSDRTDVFTEAAIFDILAANPDELKREELIKYLEEKENPLPTYMLDILKQVAEGSTYKTVLQQEMARYSHEKARAANDMIRSILNDEMLDVTQLRNWLDNLGGIESDKQIISTYVQEGNFANAFSLADMLPQLYDLQNEELAEHNRYLSMLQLQQTLFNAGRKMDQLTENEQVMLEDYALNSAGGAGAQARSILEAFYGKHFDKCESLEGSASYKSQAANLNQLGEAYGLSVSVKPNPAKEYAAFDFTLPKEATSAILTITSQQGHVVERLELKGNKGQKLWDTRKIPSGAYIYTLESAGFSKSGKLVVIN